MKSKPTQLGLGTVQFGLPYGVHALEPLMPAATVHSILDLAVKSGITFYDTAANYGEAERRLGEYGLAQKGQEILITSKIPSVSKDLYTDPTRYWNFVSATARESLSRLGIRQFELLQFHQADTNFLESHSVREIMHRVIDEGICQSIGISVYSPEEALAAIDIPGLDAIQFPLNLLDRRFLKPEIFSKIAKKRLIARSVFLQGILVSDAAIPPVKQSDQLKEFKKRCLAVSKTAGKTLEDLALEYIFGEVPELPIAIIGVDTRKALQRNLETIDRVRQQKADSQAAKLFQELAAQAEKEQILEPRAWNN